MTPLLQISCPGAVSRLEVLRDIGWFADGDTDGVENRRDLCASSDTQPFVVVGTCNSGVPNSTPFFGCTILDSVNACATFARNHGQFVSCVSAATNAYKAARVLTGAQKGAIQSCAAKASIP
jgi:hypothetical protein